MTSKVVYWDSLSYHCLWNMALCFYDQAFNYQQMNYTINVKIPFNQWDTCINNKYTCEPNHTDTWNKDKNNEKKIKQK